MERRSAHKRHEFSFGGEEAQMLPPRRPELAANSMAQRAGEEEFRWLQETSQLGSPESAVLSGSGTPSPRLWTHLDDDRRLYPASAGSSPPPSRAQAIAGYRREMLDLVRGLPEAAYELSLRDIVESRSSPLPPPPPPPPPLAADGEDEGSKKQGTTVAAAMADEDEEQRKQSIGGKKQGKQRKQGRAVGRTRSRSMERSVSLDTGLLIKLFLPLSVGGRTKKKKVSPSPKPAAADKDGLKKKLKRKKQGKKKEEEKEQEWWKKSEFSSEAGSSSRTSSSGSSNSNSSASRNANGAAGNPKAPARSRSRKRIGCYGFFRKDKSKNGAIQE